jgi:hypothetical protein
VGLLRVEEPIVAHAVSFAKQAAAFVRISRSWRTTWFSRRSLGAYNHTTAELY